MVPLLLDCLALSRIAKGVELCEDDAVFGHGAQRANEPREVCQEILLLYRMEQNLQMSISRAHRERAERDIALTPIPYVKLPISERRKKSRLSPSQLCSRWFLTIWGILALCMTR